MTDGSPCITTLPSSIYTAPSAYSSSSKRCVTHNAVTSSELLNVFFTALITPSWKNTITSLIHLMDIQIITLIVTILVTVTVTVIIVDT
ncbi:hypothetical protein Hanom_Chr04g00323941 [Helianthus anomalus]